MDLDTFNAKTIRAENGCLLWMGNKTRDGYGRYGGTGYAHRWAQEYFNGPIPHGYQVDHLCNQASCVEPTHLEPVTLQENMRRAGMRVTQCIRGHDFTMENTYIAPKTGRKSCKTCRRMLTQRFLDDHPHYHRDWRRARK